MLAVVTTATLNYNKGQRTCQQAVSSCGLTDVAYVVGLDTERHGGVKTANTAWREALELDPLFLVYINDDVRLIQFGWLTRMIQALSSKPEYGIAGAGGNCGTEPQRSGRPGLPPAVHEVAQLSFFCVVIKRAVIQQVGLLDESYIHWGCDGDYGCMAQTLGWSLIWVQDVYAEHTYVPLAQRGPELDAWRAHDLALFQKRWGDSVAMPL